MTSSVTISEYGSRKTLRTQVADQLFHMIISSDGRMTDRLPTVEDLAERFGASVGTVHSALGDLEAKGYLTKKHGSGTFIASKHQPLTLKDTVALCMSSGAHVWGELWAMLMSALNQRHLFALGMEMTSQKKEDLFIKFNHTDAGYYLVHGNYDVPFSLFTQSAFQNKPVIAVVNWESNVEWPGLYRVLTDFSAGGEMVARHLLVSGHHRVLIVGPSTDSPLIREKWSDRGSPLLPFVSMWEAAGGVWVHLPSQIITDNPLDEDQLVEILGRDDRPTAIFGTRDFEVWQAQQIIRRRLPELEGQIELVGYFDTPWSRAGAPPFSTVNLDLPALAAGAMAMLDSLREGREIEKRTVMIRPQLVVRG